jgi:hypothetical protein
MPMKFNLLMLASAMILSSCNSLGSSVPTDSFCIIAKPIEWSDSDSAKTTREIIEFDTKGAKLCGW